MDKKYCSNQCDFSKDFSTMNVVVLTEASKLSCKFSQIVLTFNRTNSCNSTTERTFEKLTAFFIGKIPTPIQVKLFSWPGLQLRYTFRPWPTRTHRRLTFRTQSLNVSSLCSALFCLHLCQSILIRESFQHFG